MRTGPEAARGGGSAETPKLIFEYGASVMFILFPFGVLAVIWVASLGRRQKLLEGGGRVAVPDDLHLRAGRDPDRVPDPLLRHASTRTRKPTGAGGSGLGTGNAKLQADHAATGQFHWVVALIVGWLLFVAGRRPGRGGRLEADARRRLGARGRALGRARRGARRHARRPARRAGSAPRRDPRLRPDGEDLRRPQRRARAGRDPARVRRARARPARRQQRLGAAADEALRAGQVQPPRDRRDDEGRRDRRARRPARRAVEPDARAAA